MARILLQTTIPYTEDDWNVGRFSLLRNLLATQHDVTARNKSTTGSDPILATIDRTDYDQIWLIAVDTGNGLTPDECRAISNFRRGGGGLFVTDRRSVIFLRIRTKAMSAHRKRTGRRA